MNSVFIAIPFPQEISDDEINRTLPFDDLLKEYLNTEFEELADCYAILNRKISFVRNSEDSRAFISNESGERIKLVTETEALCYIDFDILWIGTAKGCQ